MAAKNSGESAFIKMKSKVIKDNSLNPSNKSPVVESKELSPVSSYESDSR
jgi:hypothetical protein